MVLKEPQSNAVELKPWMTITESPQHLHDLLLCTWSVRMLTPWLMVAYILRYNLMMFVEMVQILRSVVNESCLNSVIPSEAWTDCNYK